jgi:hypothetical protein
VKNLNRTVISLWAENHTVDHPDPRINKKGGPCKCEAKDSRKKDGLRKRNYVCSKERHKCELVPRDRISEPQQTHPTLQWVV